MAELWDTVTLPQAIILIFWLYAVASFVNLVIDLVRARLGKPPLGGMEHCEHFPQVEETVDRVDRLCDLISGHIAGDEQDQDADAKQAAR